MEYIISDIYDKGTRKRKLFKRLCEVCNAVMWIPAHVDKKYCSIACRGKSRSNAKEYTCAQCNKVFMRNESRAKISKSGYMFCSRKCKDTAQRIGGIKEIHPRHYLQSNGKSSYQTYAKREHGNKCMVCGNAGIWNDKPLTLDVHHIDGNRDNNTLSNLQVICPNCHRQEEMVKWGAGDNGSI